MIKYNILTFLAWLTSILVLAFLYFKLHFLKSGQHRKLEIALRESRQARIISNLKINTLNNQFNPHFVFNSFNTLEAYILKEDKKEASVFLNKFSHLFRLAMKYSKQEYITLSEEIKMLQLYLYVEAQRFRNKFTYEIRIASSLDKGLIKIPSMLIQQIVEKSVWSSLSRKEASSHVIIDFISSNDHDALICEIKEKLTGQLFTTTKKPGPLHKDHLQIRQSIIDRNEALNLNITIKEDQLVNDMNKIIGSLVSLNIPTDQVNQLTHQIVHCND